MEKWTESKDINAKHVGMCFRINPDKSMMDYGMNIRYESKLISNYLLNTDKAFQQYRKDWIIFLLKKRYSFTRNCDNYGYNLLVKKIWDDGF